MEIISIAIGTVKVAAAKFSGITASSLLWFIGGAAITLGFSSFGGSKTSQHVYELRMYHVNEAKWMLSSLALAITPMLFSGDTT